MKNKGGRPPHEPSELQRREVETMTSYGIPEEQVARVLGIDWKTLRKHYGYELSTGHTKANAMVAQSLFKKATGTGPGSVVAAIFWLKARAGWRDNYFPGEEDIGKKEQARREAEAAVKNSDWAGDLEFDGVRPN